jgi:microcystin-dependent protein
MFADLNYLKRIKMEYYLGEILILGFNYAPEYTLECLGQTVALNQYSALYSLLGSLWGTPTTTSFFLPDLRGRLVSGRSTSFVSNHYYGEAGTMLAGTVNSTNATSLSIGTNNMPAHIHAAQFTGNAAALPAPTITTQVQVSANEATDPSPAGKYLAKVNDVGAGGAPNAFVPASGLGTPGTLAGVSSTATGSSFTPTGTVAIGTAGGSSPINLTQPLAMTTLVIVTAGIYPIRP